MFISEHSLAAGTWQAFERNICRLLVFEGFEDIRLVGSVGDQGADIIAHRYGKRWVFQAKHWKQKVGIETVDETLRAAELYRADIPAIVSLSGFENAVFEHQRTLLSKGIGLQLITAAQLANRAARLPSDQALTPIPRKYQEGPITTLLLALKDAHNKVGLVVMATGLGKTLVAAEALRRYSMGRKIRVLVLAHTNELVYQLEREFWRFLSPQTTTLVWNGYEPAVESELSAASYVFGCLKSVASYVAAGGDLPQFDVVLVDECHHVGGKMYLAILDSLMAGLTGGPFLLGLTATPWRPDETDLRDHFGDPLVRVDMVTGLKNGFLANVDYRMYTDNIDWDGLKKLKGDKYTPRQINRTLFITEWDDGVVTELQKTWAEQPNPRCIVFCGTVDHAITMRDRINSLGFCRAEAIYSGTETGGRLDGATRTRILCDFRDGQIQTICAVDIFNEGVDVPDVNIIVFQRVTHSRRIFIQQLGRGLRLSEGKSKVIVLDFVSDIRRFAAGIELKDELQKPQETTGGVRTISIPSNVEFRRIGGADAKTESFLREWLEDVAAIESAEDDVSILKFPPLFPGSKQ